MEVEAQHRKPDVIITMPWQDAVNTQFELAAVMGVLDDLARTDPAGAPDCPRLGFMLRKLTATLNKVDRHE